ncbi:hypothetical protein P4O66_011526, partial [Electrophorus voltai]
PPNVTKTPTDEACLGKAKRGRERRVVNTLLQPLQGPPPPPVFLGTLQTPTIWESGPGEIGPGAEAGKLCGTMSGYEDWYNDFQSSKSDSVDSSPLLERPSFILASLHGSTTGEEPTGCFWGGSHIWCGEYSDVILRSDRGSNREEDPAMEVEEVPHGDLPTQSDITGSENDEPPASKALPRARRPGASKLLQVTWKEVSLQEEVTPPPKANSPRAHAPTPKPRRGKKAAAPVPAPEKDNKSGALPETHAPKQEQPPLPKTVKDNPPQADRSPTQLMTGGLAGASSPFSRLLANPLCVVHVPVHVTVPVPITLNVPITLFPFVSLPVPVGVCIPVFVIVLVPVFSPAVLLTPARGRLSGPLASPFGIGLGPQPNRVACRESRHWGWGSVTKSLLSDRGCW